MTAQEYLDKLHQLIEENKAWKLPVYYSVDDEGNEFKPVMPLFDIIDIEEGDEIITALCIN
jgi:hypothetical protein